MINLTIEFALQSIYTHCSRNRHSTKVQNQLVKRVYVLLLHLSLFTWMQKTTQSVTFCYNKKVKWMQMLSREKNMKKINVKKVPYGSITRWHGLVNLWNQSRITWPFSLRQLFLREVFESTMDLRPNWPSLSKKKSIQKFLKTSRLWQDWLKLPIWSTKWWILPCSK